jgi:uncharacterized protein YhbP (UPF0306 family)
MTAKQLAQQIIDSNNYCSLATTDGVKPWSAGLYYSVDEQYVFYFVSDNTSLHAKHIQKNSHVAFTIFNSTESPEVINGLQIEGEAYVVPIAEISHAATVVYKKRFKGKKLSEIAKYLDPKRYSDVTALRLYKIIPRKFYILDPEKAGKHGRDTRIEISMLEA